MRFRKLLATLVLALSIGGAVNLADGTAHASSYMFTTAYWYSNDARMFCNTTPVYKTGGRSCGTGYLSIKYPGSSSYCYRRNTSSIWQADAGWQSWSYTSALYYVC